MDGKTGGLCPLTTSEFIVTILKIFVTVHHVSHVIIIVRVFITIHHPTDEVNNSMFLEVEEE